MNKISTFRRKNDCCSDFELFLILLFFSIRLWGQLDQFYAIVSFIAKQIQLTGLGNYTAINPMQKHTIDEQWGEEKRSKIVQYTSMFYEFWLLLGKEMICWTTVIMRIDCYFVCPATPQIHCHTQAVFCGPTKENVKCQWFRSVCGELERASQQSHWGLTFKLPVSYYQCLCRVWANGAVREQFELFIIANACVLRSNGALC